MSPVHRHSDPRVCAATTVVSGQSTVFVNGLLAAVEADEETHGNGDLVSTSPGTVLVNGKKLIVVSDTALSDDASHTPSQTKPASGSPTVNAY